MIVPDSHFMAIEFLEAGKRSQSIEVIVENRNLHIDRTFP